MTRTRKMMRRAMTTVMTEVMEMGSGEDGSDGEGCRVKSNHWWEDHRL